MSWTIERHGRAAVVTMTTNPVNAQNRTFFTDLHDAFDRLESEHADCPVVLTGQRQRFSAGLDLGEHFPLFAGPPEGVADWFAAYRATNVRLFTYPRPTVAAVNGHAFAGGLITSAVSTGGSPSTPGRGSASTRSSSASRCLRCTCGC